MTDRANWPMLIAFVAGLTCLCYMLGLMIARFCPSASELMRLLMWS